jgi:ubiquinone/menaquinone biosynthesis C-methylase UbiE
MSQFDASAREWDSKQEHWERSEAIANAMLTYIPLKPGMKSLEFGAGTGILSFMLEKQFSEIVLMDSSGEMVKVMQEKAEKAGLEHLKPIFHDMEKEDYPGGTVDVIFTQMAMHHVGDIEKTVTRFYRLLNTGGWLAIADLYREDGTFHSEGFTGHQGFDTGELETILSHAGFTQISTRHCYTVKKMIGEHLKEFPVFLMIGNK